MSRHHGLDFLQPPLWWAVLVNCSGIGNADLRNLRTIVYGGGPMYVEDCKRAIATFRSETRANLRSG